MRDLIFFTSDLQSICSFMENGCYFRRVLTIVPHIMIFQYLIKTQSSRKLISSNQNQQFISFLFSFPAMLINGHNVVFILYFSQLIEALKNEFLLLILEIMDLLKIVHFVIVFQGIIFIHFGCGTEHMIVFVRLINLFSPLTLFKVVIVDGLLLLHNLEYLYKLFYPSKSMDKN